jgi:hypothetical protein
MAFQIKCQSFKRVTEKNRVLAKSSARKCHSCCIGHQKCVSKAQSKIKSGRRKDDEKV